MKQFLILALLISSSLVYAKEVTNENYATTLSDETIKKIQTAQYQYKKCVADEMQKIGYSKIESRSATEAITKQCEKVLSNMRQVYLSVKMSEKVADRHLRKMRNEMTRRLLKQLMFAKASRETRK